MQVNPDKIFSEILTKACFEEQPVILLDIGASGTIHPDWAPIAQYCTCIAFDADDREFTDKGDSGFKKLIMINKIVSDKKDPAITFYLTSSPFCSSTLEPLQEKLDEWEFHSLFNVVKKVELGNVCLADLITQLQLKSIDWFKTDSQGTDLRLFASLPESMQDAVHIAEFEPGIIDAYQGEDKLWNVLAFMDKKPFWLSSLNVQGTKRISKKIMEQLGVKVHSSIYLPTAACWGELVFINSYKRVHSERDLLLAWVFCTLKQQHGLAMEMISKLKSSTSDAALLKSMEDHSRTSLLQRPKSTIKTKIKNRLIHYLQKW